jgi:hypothetical protein
VRVKVFPKNINKVSIRDRGEIMGIGRVKKFREVGIVNRRVDKFRIDIIKG